jgi:hypothetical protein
VGTFQIARVVDGDTIKVSEPFTSYCFYNFFSTKCFSDPVQSELTAAMRRIGNQFPICELISQGASPGLRNHSIPACWHQNLCWRISALMTSCELVTRFSVLATAAPTKVENPSHIPPAPGKRSMASSVRLKASRRPQGGRFVASPWKAKGRSHFLTFIFGQRIGIHLCQQKPAQPIEEAVFVCIVLEYPLAVGSPVRSRAARRRVRQFVICVACRQNIK